MAQVIKIYKLTDVFRSSKILKWNIEKDGDKIISCVATNSVGNKVLCLSGRKSTILLRKKLYVIENLSDVEKVIIDDFSKRGADGRFLS